MNHWTLSANSAIWCVGWLNGMRRGRLPKSESQAWLLRLVDGLVSNRGADLRVLVRKRHDLARVAITRISDHGRQQVRAASQMLIDGRSPRRLETSRDAAAVLEEQDYSPYRQYQGVFDFPKHAFDLIGEMGNEESQCAKRIDDHSNVKRWIRNLSYESAGGFSLPLSPRHFFPDFIAELVDGRIAIIEYKGPHIANDPKELHKKEVGELWAERSNGECVFVTHPVIESRPSGSYCIHVVDDNLKSRPPCPTDSRSQSCRLERL